MKPTIRHTHIPDYRGPGKPCCDQPAAAHLAQMVVVNGKRQKVVAK